MNLKSMKIRILLISFFILLIQTLGLDAQPQKQVVDQIVAVVGNEVILQSDIERELTGYKIMSEKKDVARCELLKNAIHQKLMLTKAQEDSIEVKSDQVETELNRRIQVFVQQIGSERALEAYYNKSIPEIKDEMREPVRELLLVQQMQNKILGKISVTPAEVKKYYKSIPEDSLPVYNTEVEVAQIVRYPIPTDAEKKAAKDRLLELRKKIKEGAKFENLAILYSEDEASATKGGDLGMQNKDDFVPRFAAAALKLRPDSISPIVETEFGYHLIKMVERRGDNIHVKHILIKPKLTANARMNTINFLDSLKNVIQNKEDTLTFKEAAYKYSQDEGTKNNGGLIVDGETGASKVEVDKLDASLFFVIDTLDIGEISPPFSFVTANGRDAYRMIYLMNKVKPHTANLDQDYPKIKRLALTEKKIKKLDDWQEDYAKKTYIRVVPDFSDCSQLQIFY